jgi:DNA-binding SARP family transcriptional activator
VQRRPLAAGDAIDDHARSVLAVRMFGALEIRDADRVLGPRDFGGIKPKQVLEILLVERGRAVAKDRIADLLWGNDQPQNAAATLETYVSLLRKQLNAIVRTQPGAYLVAAEDVDVDLDRFDRARQRGTRADLEAALALARGDVLDDEPHATWAVRLRETYRERVLRAYADAADAALAERDPPAALVRAEQALARDATHERACRAAMRAHHALGRLDDALAAYQRCRLALRDELGVEPHDDTAALADSLRRGTATAPVAKPPAAAIDVPLLGRSDELAILERGARRVLHGGAREATLLVVEGEAGVGKTRVLDELVARLGACRIGRARAVALERDLAFAPLAEALRSLALDALADARRYPALGEILPELGVPDNAATAATRTLAFESLVRFVDDHAPLALVLDDLQWADASSLAAIGYVLRRCARTSVVLACAFRSEEVEVDHPLRRLDAAVRLELQPLTGGELAVLGVPALHDKTGGNALLVVEYARALVEGGELPTGLRDAILARSRAAGTDAHRALVVASVLGRSFDPDVLARMLDGNAATVAEQLEALCARRLLAVRGERFDFRHDLVREVLAGSVSPARAKQLHARALDALEERHADPGELAHHAEAAGAHERALRYATRAGDAARGRWANREAVAHYERASRVATAYPDLLEPPARDALDLRLARALVTVGRPVDAEAAIARARAAAEQRGDDRALFDALEVQGIARQRGSSAPSQAIVVGEQALDVARRIGDPLLESRAHTLVGSPAGSLGRIDLALEHCGAAIAAAERAGKPPSAYPIGRIGLMLRFRGRDDEAIAACDRAQAAAADQRDEESMLMAHWVRALALAGRARYREAWASLDAIATIGHGEETFWHARVPNTYGFLLADVCLYQRALERDLESFERARLFTARPLREVQVHTLLNLATDRLGLGRLKEARADVEAVRAQVADVEYARFRWLARMHAIDAELAAAENDAARARGAADSCLALADKYGMSKYAVRGRLAMACALAADGDRAGARKHARAAAKLAEETGAISLAWRGWRAAHENDGSADDRRRAETAVMTVASGLDDAMRADFLRAAGRSG